jgi:cobalt/nickel transport system ATP-binding protein
MHTSTGIGNAHQMGAAILIEKLNFAYPDGTVALHDISLRIGENETIGIVGANGAGKSTLINHLNGYFLPQHGRISVQGVDLSKKTRERIRRTVGVVFQNPDDQLFMPRLYDDVAFGPSNLGVDRAQIAREVEAILKELGLWELHNRPPFHMSQGQKRFAAFATILVMHPSIIVMDEPTSDLDPHNRKHLIRMVNALPATRITVSHDLDFIWDTCARVVGLSKGKVVFDGAARQVLSDLPLLESYGLDLPLRLQSRQ